ncbi:MAG: type VI secretion system TssO [Ginsengibacter sp.]
MQPKNKSERTKAFLNFILLFVVSIAIILTTVFFSIQVPVKQANNLSKKMYQVEKERASTNNFFFKMSEIIEMLDSINNSNNPELLDIQITQKIGDLLTKVNSDSSLLYNKLLYEKIAASMIDLQKTKASVRKATKTENDVKVLQDNYDKLQDKYNTMVSNYNKSLEK